MDLLRQLDFDQVKVWDQRSHPTEEQTASMDCDPALLKGWTDRNLSLWDVDGVGSRPNLERILIAICKNRKNWEKIGYLIFSDSAVEGAGLQLTKSNGKTGDSAVDTSQTHYEIIGITGKQLCSLVFAISVAQPKTGVFKKSDMERILYEAYQNKISVPSPSNDTKRVPQTPVLSSGTNADPDISMDRGGELGISTTQTVESSSILTQTEKAESGTA